MKRIKLVTLLAASAASGAFAASMDSRVSELEKEMRDVRVETALGTYGMSTASARKEFEVQNWFLRLGPVYYKARVGGTEFAYTDNDVATGNNPTLPVCGRTKAIDFDWDWGVRAEIGYYFVHDDWDVRLSYLSFSTDGSKSVDAGLNGLIVPLKGTGRIVLGCGPFNGAFTHSTHAKSQYEFNYHSLDLELGRDYFISGWLALRPHWGLKSAWIDLEQVTRYYGGELTDGGVGIHTVDIKEDSDFWGLGPRLGVDSRWFLGCGFSIYGNASGSLLYGDFDVDHRERLSLCSDTNRIKFDADTHRVIPNAQLMLGLRYDRVWCEKQQAIAVRLGYDVQYFWRANQTLKIDDAAVLKYERYSEDVAVYGLMLDLLWSF